MGQTARVKRVQRARKKGVAVKDIAAKEGITPQRVSQICSGPRFQRTLAESLASMSIRRISNAELSDTAAEKILKQIHLDLDNPKSKKKFTPKDLADLGKFSHAQLDQGVAHLKDAIRRGQEELDEQLKKDSMILEAHAHDTEPLSP